MSNIPQWCLPTVEKIVDISNNMKLWYADDVWALCGESAIFYLNYMYYHLNQEKKFVNDDQFNWDNINKPNIIQVLVTDRKPKYIYYEKINDNNIYKIDDEYNLHILFFHKMPELITINGIPTLTAKSLYNVYVCVADNKYIQLIKIPLLIENSDSFIEN